MFKGIQTSYFNIALIHYLYLILEFRFSNNV